MILFGILAVITALWFIISYGLKPRFFIISMLYFIVFHRMIASIVGEYGQLYIIISLGVYIGLFFFSFIDSRGTRTGIGKRFKIATGIFFGYLLFNIIINQTISVKELLIVLLYYFVGIPIVFFALNFKFSMKDGRQLMKHLLLIGIMQIVIGYSQVILTPVFPAYYQMYTIEYSSTEGEKREFIEDEFKETGKFPIGTFGRYNNFGMFLSAFILMLIYMPQSELEKYRLFASRYFWVIAGCILLYLTNSRLSLLAFVLAIFLYSVLRKSLKKGLIILALVALAFVLTIPFLEQLSIAPWQSLEGRAEQSLLDNWRRALTFDENFANGRVIVAAQFLALIINKPLIGYGAGSFSVHDNQSVRFLSNLPTNSFTLDVGYIGIFTEIGLIGLILWFVSLKISANLAVNLNGLNQNGKILNNMIIPVFISLLIATAVNTGILLRHMNFLFYYIIGLCIIYNKNALNNNS